MQSLPILGLASFLVVAAQDSETPVETKRCDKGLVLKVPEGNTFFYVACSFVWLEKRRMYAKVLFEGQAKMLSRLFKDAEHKKFENAARLICLSPE